MIVVVEVLVGIVFFGFIIFLVLFYECGYFILVKIFGVKVIEFFVGFGLKIWLFMCGEMEYGFKWILLGGYVCFIGMYFVKVYYCYSNWFIRFVDEVCVVEVEGIIDVD